MSHVHTKPEAPQSQGNDPNFLTIPPERKNLNWVIYRGLYGVLIGVF